MSLLSYIAKHRKNLTPEEKREAGKAHILKYEKNNKIMYAIHEQPVLNTFKTLKAAIKNYKVFKGIK